MAESDALILAFIIFKVAELEVTLKQGEVPLIIT